METLPTRSITAPSNETTLTDIVRCNICRETVPLDVKGCPWCGTTLANAVGIQAATGRQQSRLTSLMQRQIVPLSELYRQPIRLTEVDYLAVGGGLGSFAWVDYLRICGARPEQIAVIGFEPQPYGRYRRLCRNSQIPDDERLRSNSDSCPDNVWGWPGYAVREIWRNLKSGKLSNAARIAWQIFGEPTLAETYTPRSGDVFAAIDLEANRIGWSHMWQQGRVDAIRKTDDGRYLIAYMPMSQRCHLGEQCYLLARYVHLAIGYPAIRLLPDLYAYRRRTGDFWHVVNAYEPHAHLYRSLQERGGTVLVRGRGIVASRIIERLAAVQRTTANVSILHLMRTPLSQGHQFMRAERKVKDHWEFQIFNWPKACWGGDLRTMLEGATDPERSRLLDQWGGTTTADRQAWQAIIEAGLRAGWYQRAFGQVVAVEQAPSGKVITHVRSQTAIQSRLTLEADFIIDATGMEADLGRHRLMHDLVNHYQLGRNGKGGLPVSSDFEATGLRNGIGRCYASGIITLGGSYAPVDTFLGLQYAAQRSIDDLIAEGTPGLRYLDGGYSVRQWLRWTRGVHP
ncbi:hypothetical protein KFU94_47950 [Chloroflexi bacterium TSY]|nr:hypothetical protein [Chloroflexi bacterium TSY]